MQFLKRLNSYAWDWWNPVKLWTQYPTALKAVAYVATEYGEDSLKNERGLTYPSTRIIHRHTRGPSDLKQLNLHPHKLKNLIRQRRAVRR